MIQNRVALLAQRYLSNVEVKVLAGRACLRALVVRLRGARQGREQGEDPLDLIYVYMHMCIAYRA